MLKLHGSLNWASKSDGTGVTTLPLQDYTKFYSLRPFSEIRSCHIPIGKQLQECFSKLKVEVEADPVIIPPTWNKAEHHQAIKRVWSRAAKELSDAEYIFIIGYSLPETDSFFRYLYGLGTVGETPLKKIEILNPDNSPEIRNRFRSMLGPGAEARFDYSPVDFETSINTIRNKYFRKQ